MIRSRRGASYIVEASLIYPVIIAVTVMLLAAAVYIYGLTAACSDMNRTVRREAGEKSRTVFYNETDAMQEKQMQVSKSGGALSEKVKAEYCGSYIAGVIFRVKKDNRYAAEAFVINEAETLWNRQAVKNAISELRE